MDIKFRLGEIMKTRLILLAILLIIQIIGIHSILSDDIYDLQTFLANGEEVDVRVSDTLACYHNFVVDQYWTGSDKWAVKFDFRDYYLGVNGEFAAQAAWIYFPHVVNPSGFSVALVTDEINQPDLSNILKEVEISSSAMIEGWNIVDFGETIQDSVVWLLVDYETDNFENFMTASAGDGSHSYYSDGDSYYNFSAQGINSELLFCLEGSFIYDRIDLELLDFGFTDDFAPGNTMSPVFTFRNDSDSYIDSVSIKFDILSGPDYQSSTIDLPPEMSILSPNETYILDLSDVGTLDFDLREEAAQYSFTATIISNDDEFNLNNSKNIQCSLFNMIKENFVIENIVDLDQESANNIWNIQQQYILQNGVNIINYFPDAGDFPFYSIESTERFNYYNLNGYPATAIGGSDKIVGFWDDYEENLDTYLTDSMNDPYTWIREDSTKAYYSADNDSSRVVLYFSNPETYLLSNYLTDSNLFCYLVEDSLNTEDSDITGSVFIKKMKHLTQFGDNYGTTFETQLSYKLSELSYIESVDNCRIVYFIQNDLDKSIDFFGSTPYLTDIEYEEETPTNDEEIPYNILEIAAYPNPFNSREIIKIELPRLRGIYGAYRVEIYNLKGQKIKKLDPQTNRSNEFYWDGTDMNQKKSSTGIYFVRAIYNYQNEKRVGESKILLLRN